MKFAGKAWRLLVGIKDALVLLLMLLFFGEAQKDRAAARILRDPCRTRVELQPAALGGNRNAERVAREQQLGIGGLVIGGASAAPDIDFLRALRGRASTLVINGADDPLITPADEDAGDADSASSIDLAFDLGSGHLFERLLERAQAGWHVPGSTDRLTRRSDFWMRGDPGTSPMSVGTFSISL